MSRFIVIFILCAAVVFIGQHLRRKRVNLTRDGNKKNKAKDSPVKSKGRLIQDPETGEYRVKTDDE